MRSRPLVRLLLDRPVLTPGAPFNVDVILASRSETPTDYVAATLNGVVTVGSPANQGSWQVMRIGQPQTARWTPGVLRPGEHRQRVVFTIPAGAPPSYAMGSASCSVAYRLDVHVAIPYWLDRRASYDLSVTATPRVPQPDTSTLLATHGGGPQPGLIYIEASLDATELTLGDEVSGQVTFANVASRPVRRVTLALVATEHVRSPIATTREVRRNVANLVSGKPIEGEGYPFRLTLPRSVAPSFDARLFSLHWYLEVRVDVVLGSDAVLLVPLEIMALPEGAAKPTRSRRVVPVGNARIARVWAFVAQRVGGVVFHEADGTITSARGSVTLALGREAFEGTLGTVATLRYPHLGLDLHLGPRGVFDGLVKRGAFEPGDPTARARLRVVAREHAQVSAFLDDEILHILATATSVDADDDGVRLRVAGSASVPGTLEAVVRTAARLLELLAAAVERIPAPAAMQPHVAAWQAFAARTGGRFEIGRVWIHDGNHDGFRFEIGTVWEPDGSAPSGTLLRVPIDPPLAAAPNVEDPALSPAAREALRALLAQDGVHVAANEVARFVPRVASDPEEVAPHLASMTALLRSLRGSVSMGPFR